MQAASHAHAHACETVHCISAQPMRSIVVSQDCAGPSGTHISNTASHSVHMDVSHIPSTWTYSRITHSVHMDVLGKGQGGWTAASPVHDFLNMMRAGLMQH